MTVTARNPEDLLAVTPVVLGFWPEESIVMMTLGADRPFHARIDLPPAACLTLAARRELEDALFAPARRLGARQVVLLYFTTDHEAAAAVHRLLRRACRRSRIGIFTALHADGEHYRELSGGAPCVPAIPYDVSDHPFVLEAMVTGRLVHGTRADLVTSLEPDEAAVARVRDALTASDLAGAAPPADDGHSLLRHGRWVEELVAELVATEREPSDAEVARLVWAMQALRVRDAAWSLIGAGTAVSQARFWSALLPRVPDELIAAPAAVLGWASWQAGDGARAWVAIDRCHRVDPGYALATHLASLLQNAVPPDVWQGGFDWTLGLVRLGG